MGERYDMRKEGFGGGYQYVITANALILDRGRRRRRGRGAEGCT